MNESARSAAVSETTPAGEPVRELPTVFEPEQGISPNDDDDCRLAVEYARLAQSRKDWPEAIRRWDLVRQRFPGGCAVRWTWLVHGGDATRGAQCLSACARAS